MQKLFREIGFACLLLVLALLLVFSLFWALSIGTVKLPVREIYETVLAQFTSGEPITAPGQGPVHDIVWLLRLPRVILASLVGCGLAVCGAFSSFIVYFANNKEGMQTIAYWMMGSLAGAKWGELAIIAPIIMASVIFFWTQSRVLNLMLLGDESAITMGTDLHAYRQWYLLISSLIVGFAVYAAGMIGFVGLIIPHVIRMFTGPDHKRLIPVSALTGAIFLVICDGLCRIIIPHTELPIGILISMIGAPSFIYLMIKKTYGFGGND